MSVGSAGVAPAGGAEGACRFVRTRRCPQQT